MTPRFLASTSTRTPSTPDRASLREPGLDPGVAFAAGHARAPHRFLIRYRIANPPRPLIRYRIKIEGGSDRWKPAATYRGTVYPWQCDHVGHMNIMWYVGKFDEANWNLFARIGLTPTYLRESGRGMAAVQQNITYKRELLAGDIVEIRSVLLEIRDKSIRFRARDAQRRNRRDRRVCEITGVHMDRQARKSAPFADAIRRMAESQLGVAEPAEA